MDVLSVVARAVCAAPLGRRLADHEHGDRGDRWAGPIDRLRTRLPDLAEMHRRVVRRPSRARRARGDRVRQPAAHLRADHRRRAHLRQRAALSRGRAAAARPPLADRRHGARNPRAGSDRWHHGADPAQPVRGRAAPGAVDDLDRALGLAGPQDPGARRGARCRRFGDRDPGGVRVDLGRRLARHHGDRQRPARRRRSCSAATACPAGWSPTCTRTRCIPPLASP